MSRGQDADMNHTPALPELTEDRREAITGRRFACEIHDAPGQCTPECAHLLANMSSDLVIDWYDPTGCSYPPPRPRTVFDFDAEAKASIALTFTPVELLDEETYDRLFAR